MAWARIRLCATTYAFVPELVIPAYKRKQLLFSHYPQNFEFVFIVRICICLNEISKTCMKCANRTFANAIERKRFWDDMVPYSCRFRTYIHISLIARLDRQTKQFLTLHKQAFAVNGSTKHIFSSTLEEEEEVQMYFQARLTWSVLSYFIPKY